MELWDLLGLCGNSPSGLTARTSSTEHHVGPAEFPHRPAGSTRPPSLITEFCCNRFQAPSFWEWRAQLTSAPAPPRRQGICGQVFRIEPTAPTREGYFAIPDEQLIRSSLFTACIPTGSPSSGSLSPGCVLVHPTSVCTTFHFLV